MNFKKLGMQFIDSFAFPMEEDKFRKLFVKLMLFGFALIAVYLAATTVSNVLYLIFCDHRDTFMDFFNPLTQVGRAGADVYGNKAAIYPPLAFVIYSAFAHFIPQDLLTIGGFAVRKSGIGCQVFVVYAIITTFAFFALLFNLKKGGNKEKRIFGWLVFLSAPFLHQFERANLILVCLILSMVFCFFYNSISAKIRHLALISLAAAISLKIYPFLFGLILLKEKRFKDIFYLFVYTLILFFGPFVFFGGVPAINLFLLNLQQGAVHTANFGFGFIVGIKNTILLFATLINGEAGPAVYKFAAASIWGALVFGSIAALLVKEKWKMVALISCLVCLLPAISYFYALIFLFIPLVMFLDKEGKRTKTDFMYMLLFILIIMPFFPAPFPIYLPGLPLYLNMFTERTALLVLFIVLIADGFIDGGIRIKNFIALVRGK